MDQWFEQVYNDIAERGRMRWETREALVEQFKIELTDEQIRLLPTISHLLYGTSFTVVDQLTPRLVGNSGGADYYAVRAVLAIVYGTRVLRDRNTPEVKDEHAKNAGHYDYIPYDHTRFVTEIYGLRQLWDNTPRFIDVGSGIGDKVLLAHLLGYNASGIEYTRQTHDIARESLHGWNLGLLRGDALEHTYDAYDLVYMYCPMKSPKSMLTLYTHVLDQLAVGGVLFEVLMSIYLLKQLAYKYGFPFVATPSGTAIQRLGEDSYRCGFWNGWYNKLEWVTGPDWQPTERRHR